MIMITHNRSSLPASAAIIGLVLIMAGACGCASKRLGRVPRGFQGDREAGVAVIGNDFSLSSNTTIATTQPVHFTIKSNKEPAGYAVYPDFRGYVHPQVAPGLVPTVGVDFSEPVINLSSGWVYLVGLYPAGRTGRIRAIGRGTEIVIEIDNSGGTEVHRVYFVSGKATVDVYVPWDAAGPAYTMTTPGTYLESAEPNAFEFKGPYGAVAERAAFIANVRAEIVSEGVH
jgi:hypothetical protein